MRKLVSSFFISLDGIVEAPQTWHFPYFNDEMGAVIGEAIGASDALLMGRRTYEEWVAFWPHQDPAENPMAKTMNETPKFVASTTLDEVDWQNTTLLDGDLTESIADLKAKPGKNIGMSGSDAPPVAARARPRRRAAPARASARRRVGREAVRGRNRPGAARARRLADVPDRRPRPHLPTGGRVSGHPTVRSADGTSIAYDSAGDGPALVLVGGAFSYRRYRSWVQLAELVAPRFRAISYDRRGRGDSGDTASYAVEREIEDLDALVQAAGGSAHVFGMSSGSVLALRAAAAGSRSRGPSSTSRPSASTPAGTCRRRTSASASTSSSRPAGGARRSATSCARGWGRRARSWASCGSRGRSGGTSRRSPTPCRTTTQ